MANPSWPVEFEWGNSGCALTVPEARGLITAVAPSALCEQVITVYPPDGHMEPPTTHRCVKPRGHDGKHATAHGGYLVEVPDGR